MSRKDENTEFTYLNSLPDSPPSRHYVASYNSRPGHVYEPYHPFVEPPAMYGAYPNYPSPFQAGIKTDQFTANPCNHLMYQNRNFESGPKDRETIFQTRTFSGNDLLADNSPIPGRSLRRLNTEMPLPTSNFCDFGTYDPFQGSPLEITNLGLHEPRTATLDQPFRPVETTPVKPAPQEAEVLPENPISSISNELPQPTDSQTQTSSDQKQNKRSYKDVLTFPTTSEGPNSANGTDPPVVKPKINNETRKETYKDKLLSTTKSDVISNVIKSTPPAPKAVNLNNHRSQPNVNMKKPLKINNNLSANNINKTTVKSVEKNWHSQNESVRSVRSQTDLGGVKKKNRTTVWTATEGASFDFPPSEDEEDDRANVTISENVAVEVKPKEKKVKTKVKEKENERNGGRRNAHKRNQPAGGSSTLARAYLPKVVQICGWFCLWLYNLCTDIVRMSWDLVLQGVESCHLILSEKGKSTATWALMQFRKGKHYVKTHWIPPVREFFQFFCRKPKDKDDGSRTGGLNANIPLPTTGEEAMHRLLACKGRDPYSILGVRRDSTDEEIRRYYKRQAVLVHPDKNRQRGAEEAFKILAHAFELIGQPERRSRYDQLVQEADEMETAWAELNQLLTKLHAKMDEAANTIRCTNCSKRHRRLKTDRPCYAARYCQDCKIHHSAREGDLWAESRYMGLLSNYYACMEGAVYDITDWANCQAGHLRHLQSNSHRVQYRIVPGQGQMGHHGPGRSKTS